MHDDVHLAGLIEELKGVHGRAVTAVFTLEGYLEGADVLKALDTHLGTGCNLIVELHGLLDALYKKPYKEHDHSCKNDLEGDFSGFVHYLSV